jgi:dolichol-phosphate mannosyltransferase
MKRTHAVNDSQNRTSIPIASPSDLEISVVVPVHNEAGSIELLVAEIQQALRGRYCFEIVVVDDGSSDNSLTQLVQMQLAIPELRILAHSTCCGQSTALWTGIRNARGAFIATLDGDGQNDPQDIPLLATCAMQSDTACRRMAAGHRRGRRDTRWRRFCSRLANSVRSRMLRDATPDSGCGIKCFPRDLFMEFPYFNHMHRFLPALAKRHGASVFSLEVRHRPRTRGQSHYGTWDRLRVGVVDLFGVMWLLRRTRLPDNLEYFEHDIRRDVAGDRAGGPTVVHGQVSRAVA